MNNDWLWAASDSVRRGDRSRSLSAENPNGAVGAGGKSASMLGPGRKGTPCITLPSGETTTIAVSMAEMRFSPDVLEMPAGDSLVIELSNDDEQDVHDLVLASGVSSGRLRPGESTTVDAGVIEHDLDGWCRGRTRRRLIVHVQIENKPLRVGGELVFDRLDRFR